MAFTDLGSIASGGNSGNNQATLTIATTASCSAGELVVVAVSVDNRATGGGDDLATSGVTIGTTSPFALTKGRQAATNLAAQAGASVSLWYGVLPNSVASGQNIVATFTTAASADATALSARHFGFASGATLAVEATNAGTSTTANPGSLNATTANLPCLRIRAIGCEWDSTQTLTVTGSWTAWAEGASAASLTVTEQVIEAEHIISTGTGSASAPTLGSACDSASVYVAFKEVYAFTADSSSYALTGTDAALTATMAAENAPGWSQWFNPWGRKRPVQDWSLFNTPLYPPTVATTFSADAGSYALTGSDATLTTTAVDTGNLPAGAVNWFNPWGRKRPVQDWLRGPVPTVPVIFTAASGSYSLTGNAAVLVIPEAVTNLPAGMTGSYVPWRRPFPVNLRTSTGRPLAVAPVTLTAAGGSYTITGSAAGLTVAGAPADTTHLPAGAGNWFNPWRRPFPISLRTSISPATKAAAAPFTLSAAAGNYALTGGAAALALRLTANSGSYTVSGGAAVLARRFAAGAGAYAITGTAAQFIQAGSIALTCGAGSYLLTGGAAALTAAAGLLPTPLDRRFKIATENRAAMVAAVTVAGKVSKDQRIAYVD